MMLRIVSYSYPAHNTQSPRAETLFWLEYEIFIFMAYLWFLFFFSAPPRHLTIKEIRLEQQDLKFCSPFLTEIQASIDLRGLPLMHVI